MRLNVPPILRPERAGHPSSLSARARRMAGLLRRACAWHALVFTLPLLAACGDASLAHVVQRSMLRDVSRQGQITVYDAENETVIALDQLDEAEDALRDTEQQIRVTERSAARAKKRGSRAGVRLAEAWVGYLEELRDWAEAQIELRRLGLVVARAAIELTKAQLVQREDLPSGKHFSLKDFRRQYERLQARYDREGKRVKRLREAARKKELRWWELRRRVVAQTGDHNTVLWVD